MKAIDRGMGLLRRFTVVAAAMLLAVVAACGGTGDAALSGDVTTGTAPLRVPAVSLAVKRPSGSIAPAASSSRLNLASSPAM